MPEGPSILILKEQAEVFRGCSIVHAGGNSRIDRSRLDGQRVGDVRSWGKHFLMQLPGFALRVHLLLFGSYRINERREVAPRLALQFDEGELNFYACSVRYLEGQLDDLYDWRRDVLSEEWDPELAAQTLLSMPDAYVCDALLDQNVFAGVGNIIKNEVLFRIALHPLSTIGALPRSMLHELIEQARQYSFDFLKWKRAFVLKQHWLAHNQRECPRCRLPFGRAYLGKTNRRSFYCEACQVRY